MSELFKFTVWDYTQRPATKIQFPITADNYLDVIIEIIRSGGRGTGPHILAEYILHFCDCIEKNSGEGFMQFPSNLYYWVLAYLTGIFPTSDYDWRTFDASIIQGLMHSVISTIEKIHPIMVEMLGASFCTNMNKFATDNSNKAKEILNDIQHTTPAD